MNTIERVDGTALSYDERVHMYMDLLHMSEAAAKELIAIEDGVVTGDVIVLEDADEDTG